MSILVNKNSKVIIQGFTGKEATFHAKLCIEYGTNIVGGVVPGKGGTMHLDRPVFNTVSEAIAKTSADTTLIFVPPKFVANSIIEAADAGIKLAVIITEHTPIKDMIFAKDYTNKCKMMIIGPNSPGIVSADQCKLGIMPNSIFKRSKTNIGLISKSGTLTYEGANQILSEGYGISTAVGIGGDTIIGLTYTDLLPLFENDLDTKAIVIIGEIGGSLEIEACEIIKNKITKPIIAFIAGVSAPKGRIMGHAGAIISGKESTAEGKKRALANVGVHVVDTPAHIGKKLKEILK